jgi:hypothetical protein
LQGLVCRCQTEIQDFENDKRLLLAEGIRSPLDHFQFRPRHIDLYNGDRAQIRPGDHFVACWHAHIDSGCDAVAALGILAAQPKPFSPHELVARKRAR